jgi:hypothetical protein
MDMDRSRAEMRQQLIELLDYPRDDLDTEIKDWLPLQERLVRANLAVALIALANHGGGYVLFAFKTRSRVGLQLTYVHIRSATTPRPRPTLLQLGRCPPTPHVEITCEASVVHASGVRRERWGTLGIAGTPGNLCS